MNTPTDPDLPIVAEVGAELARLFRAEEQRPGPARLLGRLRSRLGVAVVVGLVAASAAAAAVTLSAGSSAPVRLYGGDVLCSVGSPYLTSAGTGFVYPPNYPGLIPRGARGADCYATEQDALRAGYSVAPTPAGDVRLGPLYLGPASAVVDRVCHGAASVMNVVVFCPRVLPKPWLDPVGGMNSDCPSKGCGVPLLSITGSFAAPNSYAGSQPGEGDVTIWAVSSKQRRFYLYLVGCPSSRPLSRSRTTFRGYSATWRTCPIFGVGGSTGAVLSWRVGDEDYGVSADGPANLSRRLVGYIAAHLVREPPAHTR
jgi:hypothetical protein